MSQPLCTCPALPAELRHQVAGLTCWCVPISLGDESLGALGLAVLADRPVQSEEVALVQGIAHQIAVAFENARLTEEQTRLEAARRMELLRTEFLGSVSHELRTPLGFIKGYTTTLLREDVRWSPPDQREFLQIIVQESERLTRLLNDILDLAKMQAGKIEWHMADIAPRATIEQAIAATKGLVRKHGKLRLEIAIESSGVETYRRPSNSKGESPD